MNLLASATRLRAIPRLLQRSLKILLAAACVLGLVGPAIAEVIDVDSAALAKLQEQGVSVIDIRRLGEWKDTGVIEGSHLMTFFDEYGKYDAAQWFEEFRSQLDPEKPVALICHSGVRSGSVAAWLSQQMNIPTVYNAKDGIIGWTSDGSATVPAP